MRNIYFQANLLGTECPSRSVESRSRVDEKQKTSHQRCESTTPLIIFAPNWLQASHLANITGMTLIYKIRWTSGNG
jgi:hypothetical protein